MKKKTAMKLGICNTVITIFISIAEAIIIAVVGDGCGAAWAVLAALVPAAVHAVALVLSYKRNLKKQGIYARKFVLTSSLPPLIIGVSFFLIFFILCVVNGIGISDYDCQELHGAYVNLCVIGYSVVLTALLSAVMGISYAIDSKKGAPDE